MAVLTETFEPQPTPPPHKVCDMYEDKGSIQVPSWEEARRRERRSEKPTGDFELFFAAGHTQYLAEVALAEYGDHLFLDDERAWKRHVLQLIYMRWSHQSVGLPETAPPDYMDVIAARKRVQAAFAANSQK